MDTGIYLQGVKNVVRWLRRMFCIRNCVCISQKNKEGIKNTPFILKEITAYLLFGQTHGSEIGMCQTDTVKLNFYYHSYLLNVLVFKHHHI